MNGFAFNHMYIVHVKRLVSGQFVAGQFVADNSSRTIRRGQFVADNSSQNMILYITGDL